MESILEVERLVKKYGSFTALDGISFRIPKGRVIGLLGPNGAGKTTTIQMLLGITTHTSGDIKYFGKDFVKFREISLKRINFASAFNTLQGRITVWENLIIFAMLYGVKNPEKKIKELSNYFEMTELLNQVYWNLSAGQRTRVNIIKSLVNDPDLILMDEPTASLDPDIADKTLSLIEELKKTRDLSILFTSHDMKEVTRICDEVIFLDHGRIVAQDTPIGLTKRIDTADVYITFDGEKELIEKSLQRQNENFTFVTKNIVSIHSQEKNIPKLIFSVNKLNIEITDIEIKKPTLEDVFLQIARRESDAT